MANSKISKIQLGSTTYDIAAEPYCLNLGNIGTNTSGTFTQEQKDNLLADSNSIIKVTDSAYGTLIYRYEKAFADGHKWSCVWDNKIKTITSPLTKLTWSLQTQELVTTTGDQWIEGQKTFTDEIIIDYDGQILEENGVQKKRFLDFYDGAASADSIFSLLGVSGGNGTIILGENTANCELQLNDDVGTAGQVLTSQGSNKTPAWKTIGYHIYLNGTVGTITTEQYTGLAHDDQSYICVSSGNQTEIYTRQVGGTSGLTFVCTQYNTVKILSVLQDGNWSINTQSTNISNMVTTDTDQSLTGHKTFGAGLTASAIATFNATAQFNEDLSLACPITINNSVGTSGQVLTSQGAGKPPVWKTPSGSGSTPTNMVTTDTAQDITGAKTFKTKPVTFETNTYHNNRADFSTTAWFVSGVDLEGSSSSASTKLVANNDYQQTLWMPACKTSASDPENDLDDTLMTPAAYSSVKKYSAGKISGGIKLYGNADYNIMLAEYDDYYYPAFNINVGQDTADTNVFKVTAGQGGEGKIFFNAPLYMGTNTGSAGYALCSAGSVSVPYWKRIVQNSSISKTAYQSTGTNVTYSSATYGGSSSSVTFYYAELNNGQDTYRRIYSGRYSTSVTAGKWVRIAAPYTSATPVSVTVTPYKTTTAGYGPRLIAVGVSSYIYVGVDDDDAPAGFYVTVIY